MPLARVPRRLAPLLAIGLLLTLSGCASGTADPGAGSFFNQHSAAISRAAQATAVVKQAVSKLSPRPASAALERLAVLARRARREVTPATEWGVTESGEEEDLSQAESEVNEGAHEFSLSFAALVRYARAPSAASFSAYRVSFARGRQLWNEGVAQLAYLAHAHHPPTV